MRILLALAVSATLLLAVGCRSNEPYTGSNQLISALDNTSFDPALATAIDSAPPSPTAAMVVPSEIYVPNPSVDAANAKARPLVQPADDSVAWRVRQHLSDDPVLAPLAPQIHVEVENGTVTLIGNVPDPETRRRIIASVRDVTGVVNVDDHLESPLPVVIQTIQPPAPVIVTPAPTPQTPSPTVPSSTAATNAPAPRP